MRSGGAKEEEEEKKKKKKPAPKMRHLAPDGSIWKPFVCPVADCQKRYVSPRYCASHPNEMCIDISDNDEYIKAAKVADAFLGDLGKDDDDDDDDDDDESEEDDGPDADVDDDDVSDAGADVQNSDGHLT